MAPRNEDDMMEQEGGSSPDAPINLEIVDWDATTVKLKWKAGAGDGGAPITFFCLEYKCRTDEEWQEGPKVKPAKSNMGKVEGLTTNMKYEFRVRSENRAGKSGPSDTTMPHLVKSQKDPPMICRKAMEEKTIKVNQQLDLSVPVVGEPAPECKWMLNGAELKSEGNVKVNFGANMAKLLLIPARRANEGKYTLTATNKWGEDTVDCEVAIFGRPTICQGPLTVTEVTKKSCRLQWKAPEDNGGSTIIQYEVEKMDESNGNWLPAAQPKGTSCELKNLVENHNYMFLVRAVNKDGDSPDLLTEDFTTAKLPFECPSTPGKPKAKDWGPTWAEVSWEASSDDGGAPISEYKVEMRDVDKRSWNNVASTKETTVTVDNCGIEVEHEYVFRVTAYNAGGESETSETSTPIEAMNRFVKPRLDKDHLGKVKELTSTQMVKLEALCEAQPQAKFQWFLPNGETLLQDNERILIDNDKNRSLLTYKNVERGHSGSWKVVAKNSVGEDEHEVRVDVVSPPTRPSGAIEVSKATPTGCLVSFKKPKDDGGSPITGYYVEKKDVEKDYWSPCGKVTGKMANVMKELECEVSDLVENFVYVFRVFASNAIGDGPPLMSMMPTIAKHALDHPEQPYNINVIDFDKKWVKLDWTAASGPRVTKFVVEKQETFLIPKDDEEEVEKKGGDGDEEDAPRAAPAAAAKGQAQEYVEYCSGWMFAGETEDDTPEIKVDGLSEGYKYQFRVKAANKAGLSYPSESTEEVTAKVRKQKPKIERVNMPKSAILVKGDNLTMKVKVEGEPITDKAWFWGRREIKSSTSVNIDNSDHQSKITIFALERADTGSFSFRAENEHGMAEASIDLVVMVAPNKPKGPMRIDDVNAESCVASWNQPEDDGGCPITHYILERAQGGGENWIQCGRVAAPQTECKITGLTEGKEYRIQVRAVNAQGESEGLVGVDSFITENPFQCPGAPGKPELKDWDSDHFDVKWIEPKNDGGSRIMGYDLEARLWKDPNWFKAGEVKLAMEHGIVEGVELGQSYAVRVRARNAAGPGHWSLESDQLVCRFKALKPKVKLLCSKEMTVKEGDTILVEAEVPAEPACEDIKWFIGERELIDDVKAGITVDNRKEHKSILQIDVVSRKDAGKLRCEAVNMNGSSKGEVKLVVYGKPGPAEDRLLVSKVTATGCHLSWQACKNTGGLPVDYLVEKYAVAADTWAKQIVTSSTEFSVNDLETGKEYEFRVFAYNEIGESEPLSTAKAILAKNQYTVALPPSQPDVIEWNERQMTVRWEDPMDDGGMPVTSYTVEARAAGGEWQVWEQLSINEVPLRRAVMSKLQKGQEYQFRLIAVNKAGKSEPSHPSRPKVAKETDLLPYIDAKTLRDVTCEVKERLKFEVAMCGEPIPEVTWYKGEETIEELGDKSIVVHNTDTHSKIVFNSITKAHAGSYSVVVSNKSGEDSAKVSVKVLDRPAAPEGPMKVSAEAGAVTLFWKMVKDDGGCAIEHYQLEKKDNEKMSWAACGHTNGNSITLPGIPSGLTYTFRVCAVNRIGDSDPLTSESITIDADSLTRGL